MTDRDLLIVAVLLNSALYCVGVFIAGIITGHDLAWKLALVTVALCYLSPLAQLSYWDRPRTASTGAIEKVAAIIVVLSILVGAAGGLALFIGG